MKILLLLSIVSFSALAQFGSGVSTSKLPDEIEKEESKPSKERQKKEDRQEEEAMEKDSVLGAGSPAKPLGEPKLRKR